jgi:HSP20 family molecular chaperone IbpA
MFLISTHLTKSLVDNFYATKQIGPHHNFAKKDDGSISLRMEVPGFTSDTLWVQLMNGLLNVSGKYKSDGVTYKLDTTLKVPQNVDPETATAKVENGILTVTMATKSSKCYNLLKK